MRISPVVPRPAWHFVFMLRRYEVLILAAACGWGMYWYPLRLLQEGGMGVGWTVVWLKLLPLCIMLPWVLARRVTSGDGTATLFQPQAVLIGVLAGCSIALWDIGVLIHPVIEVTMLFYLSPIWGSLIGIVWLGERAFLGRWLAIGCGMVGLLLVLQSDFAISLSWGTLLGLTSGLLWAVTMAYGRYWPRTHTPVVIVWLLLSALLLGAVAALWIHPEPLPSLTVVTNTLPLAFFSSCVVILPTFYIFFWAAKNTFPGRVSLLMMTEVLVTIISVSWLLPDEQMSGLQWVGAALICSGCVIEICSASQPEPQACDPSNS